jgi:hypothetical protein
VRDPRTRRCERHKHTGACVSEAIRTGLQGSFPFSRESRCWYGFGHGTMAIPGE